MHTYDSEIENGMGHSLGAAFFQVRDFHLCFGHPAPDRPVLLSWEDKHKRARWIESEVAELCNGLNMVEQADAFLDIIYFALGGLVEMGINPAKLFSIVQDANMAKRFPDGSIQRRPHDGKIIKPPGWIDPTPAMQEEILRQMDALDSCLVRPSDAYYGEAASHAGKVAAQGGVEVPVPPIGAVTQNEPGGLQVPGVPSVPADTVLGHPEKGGRDMTGHVDSADEAMVS